MALDTDGPPGVLQPDAAALFSAPGALRLPSRSGKSHNLRVQLGYLLRCQEEPSRAGLSCSPYLPLLSGRGLGAEAEGAAGQART